MLKKQHILLFSLALLVGSRLAAEDWPTYLHDNRRSGVTAEQPAMPLAERWAFIARHAPQPAWPEPLAMPSRVRFDTSCHVAAAGDMLYFGSSADNKVYALDAETGQERWAYFTGGPIRIAPTVSNGRVYVASDDGWAYCLNAADGKEVWKRRAAPGGERILGHGRMISLWPMRAGVLVADGVAYFCAGIFPAEGIFIHAVRAEDGKPLWANDTSGQMYLLQPHPTAEGFTGVSPQGPMLASDTRLYIPTGRSVPAAFDRKDGRFLYWHCVTTKDGGAYALLADDLLLNTPGGRLIAYNSNSGDKFAQFPGLRMIVTSDMAYLMGPGSITAANRDSYTAKNRAATEADEKIRAMWRTGYDMSGKIRALEARQAKLKKKGEDLPEKPLAELATLRAEYDVFSKKRKALYDERTKANADAQACTKWTAKCAASQAMILAGKVLFAGGDGQVIALDADTGKEIWTGSVTGNADGLAFAGGRLFVSTDKGTIHCFGKGGPAGKQIRLAIAPYANDKEASACATAAEQIVNETGVKKGYCLVLNCRTGRLIYELAKRTDLCIYGVDPDPQKVVAARQALDAAGLYGVRAMVDQASIDDIPYSNYFANLIVSDGPATPGDEKKVLRMLKPCGGVLYLKTPDGETTKMVRGPLKGAADWTHQYANAGNTNCSEDKRVECPLTPLWFGEPGPAKMINRHCHGPAPLYMGGRMFVCANNVIMVYDAYNGLALWERDLPGSRHVLVCQDQSNFAIARDSVYVSIGDCCLRLDADTGKTLGNWPLPADPDGIERQWGYLAYDGDLLFGGASLKFTLRRIDEDAERALARAGVPRLLMETVAPHKGQAPLVGEPLTTREELRQKLAEALAEEDLKKHEKQLLDKPGLPRGGLLSDYVFCLDRKTGQHKWTYRVPDGYVFHNAIAVGGGRVFLGETDAKTKRVRVVALDSQTGEKLWQVMPKGVAQGVSHMMLVYKDDTLVLQVGGMTALSAKDGAVLWQSKNRGRGRLAVGGDTIIAEPLAYDLRTGKQVMRVHPVTGLDVPWQFSRAYGCGSISSSGNCLFFRSASIGYYDVKNDFGTTGFGGTRPGCWINVIGAGGLVLAPEGSAGCVCSYSTKTTIVLQPTKEARAWAVFSSPGAMLPVKRLAINFGAPGDREDTEGNLWIGYPRPCERFGLKLDLKENILPGLGYYKRNADTAGITGTDRSWVFASGCRGLSSCTVPLAADGTAGVYTVRLAFAEPGEAKPGQRVFDVKLQGKVALRDFDIAKEAGGSAKAVVKEFTNVSASGAMTVELIPKTTAPSRERAPLISGMEILRVE